jgi:hypothetical protein
MYQAQSIVHITLEMLAECCGAHAHTLAVVIIHKMPGTYSVPVRHCQEIWHDFKQKGV